MSVRRGSGMFTGPGAEVDRSVADAVYGAGVPSAPTLTIDSAGNLSWTSVTGSAGATMGYAVSAEPSGLTVTISGTTATVSGYSVGTTYTFRVWGVNAAGRGQASVPQSITPSYNAATGGTTADVTNYNGTGQTWRIHTMTSNTTFTVTSGFQPFSILLVGGGFNGASANGDCCTPGNRSGGTGGAGGKYLVNASASLASGSNAVTIGAGNGGNTILGSFSSASGSNGGAGGAGGGGAGASGSPGSVGLTNTITGSSVQYSGGGGGGGHARTGGVGGGAGAAGAGNGAGASTDCCALGGIGAGAAGAANRGAGGGGGSVSSQQYNCCGAGGAGGTGLAIVAYRIA